MHNRHFIINMVINGEKAPAFSATTLTLPNEQIDNTGRIIEHTRRTYSRSRAEVEQEIQEAIRPPENLQPKPKSQAQAKQWPVDAGATAVEQVIAIPRGSEGGEVASEEPAKPKRKRKRTRKKKTAETTPTES